MLAQSVAVMQPYFFPNLSYYKLVHNVEQFVFYNDVNFIKGGWINKNNILNNGKALPFRLPVVDISQKKIISTVEVFDKKREVEMLLKKLHFSYSKAPYYRLVRNVVEGVLTEQSTLISELSMLSIRSVFNYLQLPINTLRSSEIAFDRSHADKADRLISLVRFLGKTTYLNAIGGKAIYDKDYFMQHGINLFFIKPDTNEYKQFNHSFVPSLSIIDVLMFNSPERVIGMLNDFHYE